MRRGPVYQGIRADKNRASQQFTHTNFNRKRTFFGLWVISLLNTLTEGRVKLVVMPSTGSSSGGGGASTSGATDEKAADRLSSNCCIGPLRRVLTIGLFRNKDNIVQLYKLNSYERYSFAVWCIIRCEHAPPRLAKSPAPQRPQKAIKKRREEEGCVYTCALRKGGAILNISFQREEREDIYLTLQCFTQQSCCSDKLLVASSQSTKNTKVDFTLLY